jgi:hypothetical protein
MGPGLDTHPEGPPVEAVQASGIGARVTPAQEKDSFLVSFPASHGKPAAVFSFKETNVNECMGMALDIKKNGTGPVRVYADLNENKWVRGYVTAPAGKAVTLYVFERRKALAADDVKMFPGMHGIPGGKMSLWAGMEEPIIAKELRVFVVVPKKEIKIQVGNIRPFGSTRLADLTNFSPLSTSTASTSIKSGPAKSIRTPISKPRWQRRMPTWLLTPGPMA